MAEPTSNSAPKPPSSARLRAQRANAQLSTGPRTREGRRRSALNRLGVMRREIAWYDASDPQKSKEYMRLWRDVVAAFWFVKPQLFNEEPQLELDLKGVAQAWAYKLLAARNGFVGDDINRGIHYHLSYFLFHFRMYNQKCDYWLRKEFGSDGHDGMDKLREGIQARLSSFRDWPRLVESAKKGGAPRG